MSIDYNHYVVVGVDIQNKRKEVQWDDKYLPFIEGHYDVEYRIVDDRENQKFMFFGIVLAEGDKYEGIPLTEISDEKIKEARTKVLAAYKDTFEEEIDESKVKLVACTVIW